MKVVNHLVYLEWMWEPFHYVIVVDEAGQGEEETQQSSTDKRDGLMTTMRGRGESACQ